MSKNLNTTLSFSTARSKPKEHPNSRNKIGFQTIYKSRDGHYMTRTTNITSHK